MIFARGFGVADIETNTPVTPETPSFIASTTKAFTATLVGMLVDEGRMKWDEPVETYLPEFKLKVQSQNPNDRATLRDILSHRTGFTRMLETNTSLSSDAILRRASSAEPWRRSGSDSSTTTRTMLRRDGPRRLRLGHAREGAHPGSSTASRRPAPSAPRPSNMTRWLRFLLRQGVLDGKALISPAALEATWTPQIQVGGGAGYGMGWVVRPGRDSG